MILKFSHETECVLDEKMWLKNEKSDCLMAAGNHIIPLHLRDGGDLGIRQHRKIVRKSDTNTKTSELGTTASPVGSMWGMN